MKGGEGGTDPPPGSGTASRSCKGRGLRPVHGQGSSQPPQSTPPAGSTAESHLFNFALTCLPQQKQDFEVQGQTGFNLLVGGAGSPIPL